MGTRTKAAGTWALKIIAAGIMLQTLFFKFSAAPESVYIFTTLGLEPWGRIGTGLAELLAALLILYPRSTAFGALLGAGVMTGALFSHLTVLGIDVMGDGGQLFIYAIIVFFSCLSLIVICRSQFFSLYRSGFKQHLPS